MLTTTRTPAAGLSRSRRTIGLAVAVAGTAVIAAGLFATRDLHGLAVETLLMLLVVIAAALVGGLAPAVVAALVSGLTLNVLFVPPTGALAISDPENVVAVTTFLVIGVAVAVVVDRAARRTEQATRARREADALSALAEGLLSAGDRPADLLRQACVVFEMSGAAVLRRDGDDTAVEDAYGDAPRSVAEADVSVVVEPGILLVLGGHPLRAEDGSLLTAYAAHLAVVRERERAEQERRRAAELAEGNRTRTALLAAVSHDLRSPLAAARAAVSSLQNTDIAWSADDERDLLATAQESVDRLVALVDNLLDLSRLQTGAINPLVTEVDLASAVPWTVRSVPGAEVVQLELDEALPLVLADPGLLDRVVANLVENAIKHTPDGTPITIEADVVSGTDGGWVALRVSDRGPGVPEPRRAAMFAPFQRLGDVPDGDGLGLGLAVARGLTDAMNGHLSVADTPGGGLTVVVELPRAPADAP